MSKTPSKRYLTRDSLIVHTPRAYTDTKDKFDIANIGGHTDLEK